MQPLLCRIQPAPAMATDDAPDRVDTFEISDAASLRLVREGDFLEERFEWRRAPAIN